LLKYLPYAPSIIAEDFSISDALNNYKASQILCKCSIESKKSSIFFSLKLIILGLRYVFLGETFKKKSREDKSMKMEDGENLKINEKMVGVSQDGREFLMRIEDDFHRSLGEQLGIKNGKINEINFKSGENCFSFQTLEKMQELVDSFFQENRNCVRMKGNYERDEKMFENAIFSSTGEKILVIIGMLHIENWKSMLNQLKELENNNTLKEYEGKNFDDKFNKSEKFDNIEGVEKRMQMENLRRREIMRMLKRSKTIKFCHERH
jgi:hypothetical protein